MKPLFVPLKTEHFNAFFLGSKKKEFRKYGPRWNERTCIPGRDAVLAKGYGFPRLLGKVTRFEKVNGLNLPEHHDAIMGCYGTIDIDIAVISIDLNGICVRMKLEELANEVVQ